MKYDRSIWHIYNSQVIFDNTIEKWVSTIKLWYERCQQSQWSLEIQSIMLYTVTFHRKQIEGEAFILGKILARRVAREVGLYSSYRGCRKESWALNNSCFWTVVLEKTLESLLDYKEIQSFHLKGDQSWIFIGRTDAEAETPIIWPPDVKSWLIGKDPDSGKNWRQEEKGMTKDEMVGWHHQLNGHEFE